MIRSIEQLLCVARIGKPGKRRVCGRPAKWRAASGDILCGVHRNSAEAGGTRFPCVPLSDEQQRVSK